MKCFFPLFIWGGENWTIIIRKYLTRASTVRSTSCLSLGWLCGPKMTTKINCFNKWWHITREQNKSINEIITPKKYLHAHPCNHPQSGHLCHNMILIASIFTSWIIRSSKLGAANYQFNATLYRRRGRLGGTSCSLYMENHAGSLSPLELPCIHLLYCRPWFRVTRGVSRSTHADFE